MNGDNDKQSMTLDIFHLSEEHYLRLKRQQDVIVSWVTKIAEQNNVHLDLTELEYKQ